MRNLRTELTQTCHDLCLTLVRICSDILPRYKIKLYIGVWWQNCCIVGTQQLHPTAISSLHFIFCPHYLCSNFSYYSIWQMSFFFLVLFILQCEFIYSASMVSILPSSSSKNLMPSFVYSYFFHSCDITPVNCFYFI